MSAVVANPSAFGHVAPSTQQSGGGHRRGDPCAFAAMMSEFDAKVPEVASTKEISAPSKALDASLTKLDERPVELAPNDARDFAAQGASAMEAVLTALGLVPTAAPTLSNMDRAKAASAATKDVSTAVPTPVAKEPVSIRTTLKPAASATTARPLEKDDSIEAPLGPSRDFTGATPLKDILSLDSSLGLTSFTPRTHLAVAESGPLRYPGPRQAPSLHGAPPASSRAASDGLGGSTGNSSFLGGGRFMGSKSTFDRSGDDAPALAASSLVAPTATLDVGLNPATSVTLAQLPDVIADEAANLSPTAPSKLAASTSGAVKELEIALHPADLGAVSVKLRMANGKMSVVIGVANGSTLVALEGARDAIVRRLGSGPDKLEDLVIQAQAASAFPSEGFHASNSVDHQGADTRARNSSRDEPDTRRQTRDDRGRFGTVSHDARGGFSDLLV